MNEHKPVLGDGCVVDESVTIGYEYESDSSPPKIGSKSIIRSGTIIYNDVVAGDRLSTGHSALIRERSILGNDVLVGTNTVIDGDSVVGSNVSMQTGVYIPTNTVVGDNVFIGPNAILTNDPYPVRMDVKLKGPTIENHVSIGANATILPGVTVKSGSFVAAGAVVTEDVPPDSLAIGAPAVHEPLGEHLIGGNQI